MSQYRCGSPLTRPEQGHEHTSEDPRPDHPITVTPARGRVTVIAAGRTIADTRAALILKEATYPPVVLHPTQGRGHDAAAADPHQTYCP